MFFFNFGVRSLALSVFEAHLGSFVNVMSDAGDLEQLSAMVEDQGGPERSTGVCYSSTSHDAAFVVVVRRPWQSQNVI